MVSKRNPNSLLSRPSKYRRIAARPQVSTATEASSSSSSNRIALIQSPVDPHAANNILSAPITTTITRAEPEIIDISSDEEVDDCPLDLDIDWGLSFDQNADNDEDTALFEALISHQSKDSASAFGELYFNYFYYK